MNVHDISTGYRHSLCTSEGAQEPYSWGCVCVQMCVCRYVCVCRDMCVVMYVDMCIQMQMLIAIIVTLITHPYTHPYIPIYSYGYYGETGQSDTKVSLYPKKTRTLRYSKILNMSAGERHSLFLLDMVRCRQECVRVCSCGCRQMYDDVLVCVYILIVIGSE